eukprot:6464028-Pyramimonas_sp.AAC.1
MHLRCSAIIRPPLLRPYLGGLETQNSWPHPLGLAFRTEPFLTATGGPRQDLDAAGPRNAFDAELSSPPPSSHGGRWRSLKASEKRQKANNAQKP